MLTSAQRQQRNATRLTAIAIVGCGDPECETCYPYSTTDDGPTASELAEIERAYAVNRPLWDNGFTVPEVNDINW